MGGRECTVLCGERRRWKRQDTRTLPFDAPVFSSPHCFFPLCLTLLYCTVRYYHYRPVASNLWSIFVCSMVQKAYKKKKKRARRHWICRLFFDFFPLFGSLKRKSSHFDCISPSFLLSLQSASSKLPPFVLLYVHCRL